MADRARAMAAAALEVRHLSFAYDDGRAALADISFTVAAGECVGLLGPNGAGKSTLLLHLNGILPERLPARGAPAVVVDGLPLEPANVAAVRQRVGLMFQGSDDQLFCPTVWEDVAFGPRQTGLSGEALGERVRECLERVQLHGFEHRRPHQLSQGEKRRVCLAGVLACAPGVLVLDEPTSDLDPRGRREFKDLLRAVTATKIIATHDLELVVELCPRSLLLDAGRLVADGSTIDLLSDEALMLAHGLEKPHILQHRHPHPGFGS
jgi:energy-coupling factor transporter ATP-binding protein EcfA2